jgi:hypothetical protein
MNRLTRTLPGPTTNLFAITDRRQIRGFPAAVRPACVHNDPRCRLAADYPNDHYVEGG